MSALYEAVFCDHIRQEANGKHILVGVYGFDLVPGALPQTIPLSVWMRVRPAITGRRRFRFVLHTPDSEAALEGRLAFRASGDAGGSVLTLGPIPIRITAPGPIVASLSIDGGDPVAVGKLIISAPATEAAGDSTRH